MGWEEVLWEWGCVFEMLWLSAKSCRLGWRRRLSGLLVGVRVGSYRMSSWCKTRGGGGVKCFRLQNNKTQWKERTRMKWEDNWGLQVWRQTQSRALLLTENGHKWSLIRISMSGWSCCFVCWGQLSRFPLRRRYVCGIGPKDDRTMRRRVWVNGWDQTMVDFGALFCKKHSKYDRIEPSLHWCPNHANTLS